MNGIPWPVMSLQPKWYRLRFLNTGIVRPFLVKIVDLSGNNVAATMCQVIAGDGGAFLVHALQPLLGSMLQLRLSPGVVEWCWECI